MEWEGDTQEAVVEPTQPEKPVEVHETPGIPVEVSPKEPEVAPEAPVVIPKEPEREVTVTIVEEKKPVIETEEEVAYTIKDQYFGELNIVKSSYAWWMDSGKVERLIENFKLGYNIAESIALIGISRDQYYYFLEKHPGFSYVKEQCEVIFRTILKKGLLNHVKKGDKHVLMWYAERKMPEEFGKQVSEGMGAPTVNIGTIINAPMDPSEIKPSVMARILAKRQQANGNGHE